MESTTTQHSHVAELAWQLLKKGVPTTSPAGAFTSPLSLYVALALALRGASGGTEQELYHVLHADKARLLGLVAPKDASAGDVAALLRETASLSASLAAQAGNGAELVLANGVWSKGVPVSPEYAAAVKDLFGAEAQQVTSVDPINAWAARVTKGLIESAVPPGTRFDLVLTNAVYFKGLWELSFDKSLTQQRPFALEGGGGGGGGASSSSVDVPMMFRHFKPTDRTSSRERAVRFIDCAAYQAVRLPYKGCSISAVAVLPAAAAVAKHGSLAAAVADVEVAELLGGAKYRAVPPAGLELHMPKFTVKSECVSLKQPLQQMGLKAAFDAQTAAFERLSPEPLYISDVLQSVCVIVDEEGTEAAAVTAVVMMRCAAVMTAEPVVIKLDRPFLFMLVDDSTNTPLFVGTVADPSK